MRLRNRIAEFHGAEQLAHAGEAVLSDLSLDGAIIRGGIEDLSLLRATKREERIDKFYSMVGEATQLDKVVDGWSSANVAQDLRVASGIASTTFNNRSSNLHIDFNSDPNTLVGPLSFSVRIDPYDTIGRSFAMRRIRDAHGNTIADSSRRLEHHPLVFSSLAWLGLGFSRVEQHPGDIVVIPNYPYPSIHRVNQPNTTAGRPAGIVFDYRIFPAK